MNKYGNKKTELDGMTFESKKEASRYAELKLLQKAGIISGLECQPRFEIIPKCGNERAAFYTADFRYTDNETGKTVIEDVKSIATKTQVYILRRKLFKYRYPDFIFKEV